MMTHLDGLCVAINGKLVPASLEILVTTVLGGRGFLQRICRLLLNIFYRNLKTTCYNVGYDSTTVGDLGVESDLFGFLLLNRYRFRSRCGRRWGLNWGCLLAACLLCLLLLVVGGGAEEDVDQGRGHRHTHCHPQDPAGDTSDNWQEIFNVQTFQMKIFGSPPDSPATASPAEEATATGTVEVMIAVTNVRGHQGLRHWWSLLQLHHTTANPKPVPNIHIQFSQCPDPVTGPEARI